MANTTQGAGVQTPPGRRPGRPSKREPGTLTAAVRAFGRSGYARLERRCDRRRGRRLDADDLPALRGQGRAVHRHTRGRARRCAADGLDRHVPGSSPRRSPSKTSSSRAASCSAASPSGSRSTSRTARSDQRRGRGISQEVLQRRGASRARARVEQAVASRLMAMAATGVLCFADAGQRRRSSSRLPCRSSRVLQLGELPSQSCYVGVVVAEGVHLFLYGYVPRPISLLTVHFRQKRRSPLFDRAKP